jgi:hypothetical protein
VFYERGTPVLVGAGGGESMGRLGQDKPAFGWELEPLPLLLYRAVTLCSYIGRDPSSGNTRIELPCLHTMDAPCWFMPDARYRETSLIRNCAPPWDRRRALGIVLL